MIDYDRHRSSLNAFITTLQEWKAADGKFWPTSELEANALEQCSGAQAAIDQARITFRLHETSLSPAADDLRNAVHVVKRASGRARADLLEAMLDQLRFAGGRLDTLAADQQFEAARQHEHELAVEHQRTAAERHPVSQVQERWKALSTTTQAIVGAAATIVAAIPVFTAAFTDIF